MDEYFEFISTRGVEPPAKLSKVIIDRVHSELNPAPWMVFSKLAMIHAVVGTVTLQICPHFGSSPLSENRLMQTLMQYGDAACMLGCGAIYLGSSGLAASFLLRSEEIRVLRQTEALQIPLLGLLSIGAFVCFGPNLVAGMTTAAWFLGSVLGGMATLEIGWLIRRKILAIK